LQIPQINYDGLATDLWFRMLLNILHKIRNYYSAPILCHNYALFKDMPFIASVFVLILAVFSRNSRQSFFVMRLDWNPGSSIARAFCLPYLSITKTNAVANNTPDNWWLCEHKTDELLALSTGAAFVDDCPSKCNRMLCFPEHLLHRLNLHSLRKCTDFIQLRHSFAFLKCSTLFWEE